MICRAATLQLAVFILLSLFWCTKQRTSPQRTSQRSRHSLHDANNHAIHSTTPTITPFTPRRHLQQLRYHHLRNSPFSTRTVRSRSPRDGWKERGWQQQRVRRDISCPKLPPEYLPPKPPAQNSRSNISRPNLPSLVVLSEKGGGGGASSPDWRMRGVTWPGRRNAPIRGFSGSVSKEGGAKSGARSGAKGRAPPYKRRGRGESLVGCP